MPKKTLRCFCRKSFYPKPFCLLGLFGLSLGFCALASPLLAAEDKGTRLYQQEAYSQARAFYEKHLQAKPKDPYAHYSLGCAAYQEGDYPTAQVAFEAALHTTDPALQAKAFYNLGNTHFQQACEGSSPAPTANTALHTAIEALEKAITAYKNSLSLEPDTPKANANLALAEKELERLKNQEKAKQDQQNRTSSPPTPPPSSKKEAKSTDEAKPTQAAEPPEHKHDTQAKNKASQKDPSQESQDVVREPQDASQQEPSQEPQDTRGHNGFSTNNRLSSNQGEEEQEAPLREPAAHNPINNAGSTASLSPMPPREDQAGADPASRDIENQGQQRPQAQATDNPKAASNAPNADPSPEPRNAQEIGNAQNTDNSKAASNTRKVSNAKGASQSSAEEQNAVEAQRLQAILDASKRQEKKLHFQHLGSGGAPRTKQILKDW